MAEHGAGTDVNSPEFKAAVAAEVAKYLADLKPANGEISGDNRKFAQELALAFATLSGQHAGIKYVAPEIIQARNEARDKMVQLIIQARNDGKMPAYRVTAKTLLDDQIVEPMWVDNTHKAQSTEIDWPGVPNDAMVPLNDVAKEIHAAFLESVGSKPQYVKNGALFDAPDATLTDYHTTARGLVVRGAPPNPVPEQAQTMSNVGLSVHHKGAAGTVKETRVLGTVAAPARQNA